MVVSLLLVVFALINTVIHTSEASVEVHKVLKKLGYPAEDKCNVVSDIVFVIDDSKSMTAPDFQIIQTFMKSMVDRFKPVGYCGTQFASLCFGTETEDHFFLNAADNDFEYKALINGIVPKMTGFTRTDKALKEVDDYYFLKKNGGKRLCGKEFVILLTDGDIFPHYFKKDAAMASHHLQDGGVTIFGIAIGNNVNLEDLKLVSSPGLVYTVQNSASISGVIDKVVDYICSNPKCKSLCGRHKKKYYSSSSSSSKDDDSDCIDDDGYYYDHGSYHDDDSDCYDDDSALNDDYGSSSSDSSHSGGYGKTVINIGLPDYGKPPTPGYPEPPTPGYPESPKPGYPKPPKPGYPEPGYPTPPPEGYKTTPGPSGGTTDRGGVPGK